MILAGTSQVSIIHRLLFPIFETLGTIGISEATISRRLTPEFGLNYSNPQYSGIFGGLFCLPCCPTWDASSDGEGGKSLGYESGYLLNILPSLDESKKPIHQQSLA